MEPPSGDLVIFEGAKIDRRRVKLQSEPETGRVYGVHGFLSGPLEGAPEDAALQFLDANYRLFESKPSAIRELEVERVTRSPAGYHVMFQQVHQGIPVEEATVSVHLTPDKRVHAAYGRVASQVAKLDVKKLAENGIDRQEAIRIALHHIGAGGDLSGSARAEQVILLEKEPRLAWKVQFATQKQAQEWTVWVDAVDGTVLRQREISME
ncbi:MAG: PepSY domain-containing protein [Anaerolineae bacterium]